MDTKNVILVLEKTVSPVKEELQMALSYLDQALEQDMASFLSALSHVIAGVHHSTVSRIQAGLQIKNALYAKNVEICNKKRQRWSSISSEIRSKIKKNILNTLGTENIRPSSAAVCIAQVACIEIPTKEWPELIGTLTANVTALGSTEMMKESSLETIGYICQDIAPSMLLNESNLILTAIVHGMKKDESASVKLAATNSLFNSLEFTRTNFDMETERHFIMQVVCDATQCTNTAVKVAALQCLVKIMSLYYSYMEHYMAPALFAISVEAMKSDITEVALQGIEFWSNVCDEEVDLGIEFTEAQEEGRTPIGVSKEYAKGALQYLIPILTDTLCKQDDCDTDEDWNAYKAAGVCLVLLASCCSDDVVQQVVVFVSNNINHADWKHRDAAVMAFGSIMDGPSMQTLKPLCCQALPTLMQLLTDPSIEVRDTAAWTLGRICEVVPDAVLSEDNFVNSLIVAFIAGLDMAPRVASNICWALNSIAQAAFNVAEAPEDGSDPITYVLSPCYESIVQKLLATTDRNDSGQKNLRCSAYEALMEFIKNSPKDCYISVQKIAMVILERIERVIAMEINVTSQSDRSQYNDLQSNLCATLQSVLRKVKEEDAPIISDNIMKALLSMLSNQQAYGVQEDAMQAISSLIEVMGDKFLKYTDSLQPYLMAALKLYTEEQMCIVAIGMVSDLCRAITSSISVHMDSIMLVFLEILASSTASNKIKPHILSSFGDIAMAMGREFVKYIDVVFSTLTKVPKEIADRGDYDRIDYLNELRESCLDAYAGIIQGLRSEDDTIISPGLRSLLEFVPDMLSYLKYISGIQFDVADCVYAAACGLIGDLALVYKDDIKNKLDEDWIGILTAKARKSKVSKTRQLGNWANKEIRKLNKKPMLNRCK